MVCVASYASGAAVGSSTTSPVTAAASSAATSSTRVPQRGQNGAPAASGSSHTRQRSGVPFATSGAQGQPRRDRLVVHPVGELPRQAQRALGLCGPVAGEPARRRDDALGAQPDRITPPPRQLAP